MFLAWKDYEDHNFPMNVSCSFHQFLYWRHQAGLFGYILWKTARPVPSTTFPKYWNIYKNSKTSSKYHFCFNFVDLKTTVFSIFENFHSYYSQHEGRSGQNLDEDIFDTIKTAILCTFPCKNSTKIGFG